MSSTIESVLSDKEKLEQKIATLVTEFESKHLGITVSEDIEIQRIIPMSLGSQKEKIKVDIGVSIGQ